MLGGALRPLVAVLQRSAQQKRLSRQRLIRLVSEAGRRPVVQRRRLRLPG
jgi:hypothetical protein